MQAVNGRADLAGPRIDLGDFLPERREVSINGNTHLGWVVKDGHYPRVVLARLGRAYRRYVRAIAPLLAAPPVWMCVECEGAARKDPKAEILCSHTDSPEYAVFQQEVEADLLARQKAGDDQDIFYADYLTDCVLTLVPGALESEVVLMPTEKVVQLLEQLGYFEPNRDRPTTEQQEGEKSAGAPPLTGTSSPLDSPASTASVQTHS